MISGDSGLSDGPAAAGLSINTLEERRERGRKSGRGDEKRERERRRKRSRREG